jgi:hypothetical protein
MLDSHHDWPIAPNRLDQKFAALRPNQIWLADIVEIVKLTLRQKEPTAAAGRAQWACLEPVSGNSRTSLLSPETEIGK